MHKSWIEFWEGEHRQAAQAAIALARAGEAAKFVGFFRTLRGEPKWWDVAVSPILDANGKPERLLAVSRDVTERRQAELNFEFLASVSRDLVQWTSVEEMVQTVGAKMAAYFQLSLCAFVEINETAQQVVINHDWHREDVPSLVGVYRLADFVEETFIQIARAGEVIVVGNVATDSRTDPDKFATLKIASFICVPLIRDGQWRFALCLYKSAAYDWREDEIALTRELTARIWTRLERLRAEAAVLESEKLYRDLFNSIDEGFCIIELIFDGHETAVDWRYLEVNPAFEKQTGIAGITGKRIRELAPDHEEYWFETYGKVAVTGEPVRFTHEANALDGRWFDLYAFRVGGRDSCKVAVLFTNITERKRVESKLNEAIAVAKSANLAKSDFLSSMSHELRTPLSAILGFAQLIDSSSPGRTASQKRSVDQILKAGWYLLDLINEILDLALIESGKLSLSMEPMSLASVMDECQSMIEPQARARGINVTFPALDGACLVFVKADRTRVKQVLINLLSNAIKYNTVGGSVVVDCMAAVRGCVRISIKDAGAGLTAEQRAQLFQPFNRLGQESKAEEGTGIGLVLSKRLVELMGGTIGVESSVGIGSVFWIELNLTAAPQLGAGAGHGTAAVPAQGQGHAAVRTLLYVEDNPANLMLVEDIIARRPDIHLLSAADGLTGVTMALASLPDVILMDINLPGISGIQAMQILAENPVTAYIPVVALSANAMPRDIEKGLQAGFFRYLTKPIKVNEFMETLDVTLKFAETEKTRAQKMQRPLVITAGETSAP